MLGALYAALGAFTFALNNATMRRGVVTGTVAQGMAITVPAGALTFLVMALVSGNLGQMVLYPAVALAWLAAQGIVHFVFGRYCNYKANQLMGVNLSAPVVQLQAVVAIVLAVATMNETFTLLQGIGAVLMLIGSFAVQHNQQPTKSLGKPAATPAKPRFEPQLFSGYCFGIGAACCYGASPLLARQAFLLAPDVSVAAGGCVAYLAATLFFSVTLLRPGAWREVQATNLQNAGWFLASAIFVAISQAFVYASLAVAPLLVVTPILQLSLIFRLFLSQLINKDHEILNAAVIAGAVMAVVGSIVVSLDSAYLVHALRLPTALARLLTWHLAGQ